MAQFWPMSCIKESLHSGKASRSDTFRHEWSLCFDRNPVTQYEDEMGTVFVWVEEAAGLEASTEIHFRAPLMASVIGMGLTHVQANLRLFIACS